MVNNDPPIINLQDQYVIQTVFDRVEHDKALLEECIQEACTLFLQKYRSFKIEDIQAYDIAYGNLRCVVNLKLK